MKNSRKRVRQVLASLPSGGRGLPDGPLDAEELNLDARGNYMLPFMKGETPAELPLPVQTELELGL